MELVDVICTLKTVKICHYDFSLLTESFPSAFNRQGHANTFQSTIINAISPEIRSASPMIMMSIIITIYFRSDLRLCESSTQLRISRNKFALSTVLVLSGEEMR